MQSTSLNLLSILGSKGAVSSLIIVTWNIQSTMVKSIIIELSKMWLVLQTGDNKNSSPERETPVSKCHMSLIWMANCWFQEDDQATSWVTCWWWFGWYSHQIWEHCIIKFQKKSVISGWQCKEKEGDLWLLIQLKCRNTFLGLYPLMSYYFLVCP